MAGFQRKGTKEVTGNHRPLRRACPRSRSSNRRSSSESNLGADLNITSQRASMRVSESQRENALNRDWIYQRDPEAKRTP